MPDDDVSVLWKPFPGMQEVACRAGEEEVFLGGSKGPGKSDVVLFKPLQQVHYPAFKALILREEFKQLEELIRRSHQVFPRLRSKPHWNGKWQRWDFPNPEARETGAGGASVNFGHARTVQDVQKHQGGEWGYVGYDELGNVADQRVWVELLKEIRCKDKRVVLQAVGSGNPGYPGHGWTKRRFIVPCGKDGSKVVTWELELPNGMTLKRRRRFIPGRIHENPVYSTDKVYLATLWSLPEERRKALLEGNYDAAIGIALAQLNEDRHFVKPFNPPHHWRIIGGFDWGFAHLWVFTWAAVDEDGRLFIMGTLRGQGDLPDEIARNIRRGCPVIDQLRYVSAGHDCWAVEKHRGDQTPKIAEELVNKNGIPLIRANQDRVHGLNNMRRFLAWKYTTPAGIEIEDDPHAFFMDNPGNRWLFEQCETIVVDPDRPEYPLKIDVDTETGEGGDDGFDAARYMIASRPPPALPLALTQAVRAWSPDVLAHEARVSRIVTSKPIITLEDVDPMSLEHIA
jgi:hypothetical protein